MNAKSPSLPDLKSALKDMLFYKENGHFKDHKEPKWILDLDPDNQLMDDHPKYIYAFSLLNDHIYKMFLKLD
jgi:hypothetical protein